jgi:FkbM family methyltransferase
MEELKYYSQLGQDKFIDDFFNQKENGFFIDIGAHDGMDISNTYFLEKIRNWKGICIEPQPDQFEILNKNRTSINLNCGIYNILGEMEFTHVTGYGSALSGISDDHNNNHKWRIDNGIEKNGGNYNKFLLQVRPLQDVLDEYQIYDIDFCSIDTEGSELKIVESIDYTKTNIKVFIIENNYGEEYVQKFLKEKGYELHCKLQWDDVFIKKIN